MRALVVTFILTACQNSWITELVTQPGQVLYHDDFSDPESGWPQSPTRPGFMGYDQGSYRMLVLSPLDDLQAVAGQSFGDVRIEVDLDPAIRSGVQPFWIDMPFPGHERFLFFCSQQ